MYERQALYIVSKATEQIEMEKVFYICIKIDE